MKLAVKDKADQYGEGAALTLAAGHLNDSRRRLQIGRALKEFADNRAGAGVMQPYILLRAHAARAAILPADRTLEQFRTAQDAFRLLSTRHASHGLMQKTGRTDFKHFCEQAGQFTDHYQSNHFLYPDTPRLPAAAARCLDENFAQTPTYAVCQIFKNDVSTASARDAAGKVLSDYAQRHSLAAPGMS